MAVNSTWGKKNYVNGVDYTQSIMIKPVTFPNETSIAWHWKDYEGVRISIGSPTVVTWPRHNLRVGQAVHFRTTGALPTGLAPNPGTVYYWVRDVLNANQFTVSERYDRLTVVNTSGSQSGKHSGFAEPYGGPPYGYPCIVYGNYGFDINANVLPTPKKIRELRQLKFFADLTISGEAQNYAVVWDGFTVGTPNGIHSQGTEVRRTEIYIQLHMPQYGLDYEKSFIDKGAFTSMDGTHWKVWRRAHDARLGYLLAFGRADGGDMLKCQIDAKELFDFAVSQGLMDPNEFFRGIGLGVEMRGSIGGLIINSANIEFT